MEYKGNSDFGLSFASGVWRLVFPVGKAAYHLFVQLSTCIYKIIHKKHPLAPFGAINRKIFKWLRQASKISHTRHFEAIWEETPENRVISALVRMNPIAHESLCGFDAREWKACASARSLGGAVSKEHALIMMVGREIERSAATKPPK